MAWPLLLIALGSINGLLFASDLDTAEQLFREGKYTESEVASAAQVELGIWNERWTRVLMRCQLVQGKYAEALAVYENAVKRYPTSVTLRMMGIDALRHSGGTPEQIELENARTFQLLQSSTLRYASRDNLIAAGRYFTAQGEDARDILELFYDRVRDSDPNYLEAYIATAELALEKGDFKVAGDTLQAAERVDASDPRTAYLLARSFESSDSSIADASLKRALSINPNHVPSLLFQAESAIDREQYEAAERSISAVLKINAKQPEAWALRAVIAHLRGEYDQEKELRSKALETWNRNPQVDSLIGVKLSQKYRFAEGAEYQRRALTMDPGYLPAQFQLAQDLLRLGENDIGWQMASGVAESDPYNVVAHNLTTLKDRLNGFSVLETEDMIVRMDPDEARIYGGAVMELLREARSVLCQKYEIQPDAPIAVEIFPEQNDFAIRTFGLPGGDGYLGVCFGRVITANSPASQGERPSNWKSVLWHEFCHVVTLEKTKNRMPRWLSEGISVYEERAHDASWGESMTPTYRKMMLGDELTPVSQLSGAFLSPKSPMHLQFAYYESSLVVEFIIEKYGIEALRKILVDLGDGMDIKDALGRNVGSTAKLDSEFAEHAKTLANAFGAKADWSRDGFPERPSQQQLTDWLKTHPHNYWALTTAAEMAIAAKQYELAADYLKQLDELGTFTGEQNGPLERLSIVYRQLGQVDAERNTLSRIINHSSDALPSLNRLIELSKASKDWKQVANYSDQVLAIQPLLPGGHQSLAEAAEQLDQPARAINPLTALTYMQPVDPAGLHYRLAKALADSDQSDQAKHHVLIALDEAPRYRDAHQLLLQLVHPDETPSEPLSAGMATDKDTQ
ncbi:tetratricopeptide repeat protein [Novipirellula artificiosorum]|uniref:Tetratricopeptide repeat protein n=2 Tax=Novipirellula artificiosorum TaxID=2528016 RepID=A0A5C6D764_9BACT|nr:tetratricopeptide repeat protein [Novipirellula artificiosorum]